MIHSDFMSNEAFENLKKRVLNSGHVGSVSFLVSNIYFFHVEREWLFSILITTTTCDSLSVHTIVTCEHSATGHDRSWNEVKS